MRTSTRILAGLVAAPLVLGGVAACNKSEGAKDASAVKAAAEGKDAKTRFIEAMDKTGDTQKLGMTFKLDTTPENFMKLMDAKSRADKTSQMMAKLIAGSTVSVDTQSAGKTLKEETDPAKVSTSMAWKTDSDLAKIATTTGAFKMSDIQPMMAQMPPWIQDAVNGKWIGFSKATVDKLSKAAGADTSTSQLTPEQSKQLADAFKKNLETNATFTGDGDQITVNVKAKPFVNTFVADGRRIAPKAFEQMKQTEVDKGLQKLKADATFPMTATLSDGKVTQMKADLMKVMDLMDPAKMSAQDKKDMEETKAKGVALPFQVDMGEPSRDVSAPAGARMVTDAEIQQLMGGMRGAAPTPAG